MLIGGFQKFSLIDYPGKISAIVFTQGCNFRCPYCHNPELVDPNRFGPLIPEEKIYSFLEKRKGMLDGVEITGGEPTLQPDLIQFIEKIKNMDYLIKLDTNGSNPGVIKELIESNRVDYIAMDIKAPLEKYKEVVKTEVDPLKIKRSIDIIRKSPIEHEFRTTIAKNLLTENDIISIARLIKGEKLYVLQKFVSSKSLDPSFTEKFWPYSNAELSEIKHKVEKYVERVVVR